MGKWEVKVVLMVSFFLRIEEGYGEEEEGCWDGGLGWLRVVFQGFGSWVHMALVGAVRN